MKQLNSGLNAKSKKKRLIESAAPGEIVAFTLPSGEVKSAKIIKKSSKRRKFMLETSYGGRYIVSYDSIVWVRHGKMWPNGVFKLFGKKKKGGNQDVQSR